MTTYADLPDAELNEEVAKKLNYRVESWLWDGLQLWKLTTPDGVVISQYDAQKSATWLRVPSFSTSLDACDEVKKWLREREYRIEMVSAGDLAYSELVRNGETKAHVVQKQPNAEPRALCLAFMEVKE